MKIDPNAPAYPVDLDSHSHGLSIRAHFAAMCLQGLMANQITLMAMGTDKDAHKIIGEATDMAVTCADKLIESLNK